MERRDFLKISGYATIGYLLSGCAGGPMYLEPGMSKTVTIGEEIGSAGGYDMVIRTYYLAGITDKNIIVDYRESVFGPSNVEYARPAFNRTLYFSKRVGTIIKIVFKKFKVIKITPDSITIKRIA